MQFSKRSRGSLTAFRVDFPKASPGRSAPHGCPPSRNRDSRSSQAACSLKAQSQVRALLHASRCNNCNLVPLLPSPRGGSCFLKHFFSFYNILVVSFLVFSAPTVHLYTSQQFYSVISAKIARAISVFSRGCLTRM